MNKREKKMLETLPTAFVFDGAILGAIGALGVSQRQARRSDEIQKLNEKIAAQQEQLAATSDEQRIALSRIEAGLNRFRSEGKITKQDVEGILNVTLGNLKSEIRGELKPTPTK